MLPYLALVCILLSFLIPGEELFFIPNLEKNATVILPFIVLITLAFLMKGRARVFMYVAVGITVIAPLPVLLFFNYNLLGNYLISLGFASNSLVILANKFTMPVNSNAMKSAGIPRLHGIYSPEVETTRLRLLCDRFHFPRLVRRRGVCSIGDVLSWLGALLFSYKREQLSS